MRETIDKITKKNSFTRIIILLFSLTLSAVVYNIFLLPLSLVTGGTGGVATITKYVYGINPSLMILLLSIACLIFSLMYLGKEKTIASLLACVAYPFLVWVTSPLSVFSPKNPDFLLLVIFASVLGGISSGLIYRTGYNSGGFNIICQILLEHKKISIAKSNLVINGLIVILGSFFFGTTKAFYAIIYIYISNMIADKVLLGVSDNKAFYIITDEEVRVKEYIIDYLGHDVTVFDVKGGFLEEKRKVILTVIPTREYYKMTEGIKQIDKDVFFVVTDSYQVEGGK